MAGSVSAITCAWFTMPPQLCITEAEPILGCYYWVSPLMPAGSILKAAGDDSRVLGLPHSDNDWMHQAEAPCG